AARELPNGAIAQTCGRSAGTTQKPAQNHPWAADSGRPTVSQLTVGIGPETKGGWPVTAITTATDAAQGTTRRSFIKLSAATAAALGTYGLAPRGRGCARTSRRAGAAAPRRGPPPHDRPLHHGGGDDDGRRPPRAGAD